MAANADLEKLKAAYKAWHETKGDSANAWLNLMDEDFRLVSMGDETRGLAFAKARNSRQEAVAYLTALREGWSMLYWTPETFTCEGDRIAMFGTCGWTNKATGKRCDVRIAHLWRFKDGKAVEVTEIFDSARAAAAATP